MTNERIKHLVESGAVFLPPSNAREVGLANAALQRVGAAILPGFLTDFYYSRGGAILGDACVFPVGDTDRPDRGYVMPGIDKINRDLAGFATLRGKTVWGRNQLYWFSADVSGNLYMHDVLTLRMLRKYDNFGAAVSDCLLVGKL
jgi:hypothetical protein